MTNPARAPHAYRIHGWSVASPWELPATADPSGAEEIALRLDDPRPPSPKVPDGELILDQRPTYEAALVRRDGGDVYWVEDSYEVAISADRRSAAVAWAPDLDASLQPMLIGGGVLAVLSTLRGRSCLHATTVSLDGGGIAIIGESGQGKTTTAALLVAGGAAMVTDDVTAVDVADGRLTVPRGLLELRLRRRALELVPHLPDGRLRTTPDGRAGLTPAAIAPDDGTPLSCVVVPIPTRDSDAIAMTELRGADAFLAVTASPRLEGWIEPCLVEQEFDLAARVCDAVPVLTVTVPWGGALDRALGERLAAALAAR